MSDSKKKGGFLRRLFRRGKKERGGEETQAAPREAVAAKEPAPEPELAPEPEPTPAPPPAAPPPQAVEEPAPEADAALPEEPVQEAAPEPEEPAESVTRDTPEPEPASAPAASETAGEAAPEEEQARVEEEKSGWFSRLRQGLSKSSSALGGGITGIFSRRRLDAGTLQDLEDILIQADLGVDMAERVIARISKGRYEKGIGPDEVKAILAEEVEKVLKPVEQPFEIAPDTRPFIVLAVGVNGSGKTTTIGKLAAIARAEGHSVMLVAGDTFRAAAVEQLGVWAERAGARFMSRETGADAAALAYDAVKKAREDGVDIVFIDTAGRLQNKKGLMDELAKIVRVVKKLDESAPHAVLLVLDATTGQNAMNQAEVFREVAGVTGLVMTKLDGTARGGILAAIAEKHKIPVHAIGVGEKIGDLQPFDARAFARAIAGLDGEGA